MEELIQMISQIKGIEKITDEDIGNIINIIKEVLK